MKLSKIDVFAVVYVSINYLILIPLMIYSANIFNKKSSCPVIKCRDKKLVFSVNILVFLLLLIERPLQLCYRVWNIINNSTIWIVIILAMSFLGGFFILFSVKVYHLYFKYQYNLSIADISWRKDINPNYKNWYISHKYTFGSSMYLIKLSFATIGIFVIIEVISWFTAGEGPIFVAIHAIIIIMSLTTACITYWKIQSFNDVYNIKNELFYQFILIIIGLISYVLLASTINNYQLQWLLIIYATSYILAAPLALSSLFYPLYLIRNTEKQIDHNNNGQYESFTYLGLEHIKSVIADDHLFISFMQYLIKEFCCEILLFIVELYQIKLSFQSKNNNIVRIPKQGNKLIIMTEEEKKENENEDDEYIMINLNDHEGTIICCNDNNKHSMIYLPSTLPQTIILDKYDNIRDQMKCLFLKYIKVNSYHQLNISFEMRQKLTIFFDHQLDQLSNNKDFKLFNIFDAVFMEMLYLLDQPFQRFMTNNGKIKTHIKKQKVNSYSLVSQQSDDK